jgi:O-antigen/teichoic acid export membrane protein
MLPSQFEKTSRTTFAFRGSLLNTGVLFLQVGVAFYLMPLVISSLGEQLYGIWRLIAAFVGYYGLLDFGISTAVMRFISRSIGEDNRTEIKLYASSAFWILSAIGFLIIAITIVVYYFGFLIIKSYEEARLFSISTLILGFGIGISFPFRLFVGVLNANLRFDLARYIEICETILRTALIIVLLKKGYGIFGLAFAGVSSLLFRYFVQTMVAFKIEPDLKINFRWIRVKKLKEMGEYGFFNLIQSLAELFRSRIDPFVVAAFINVKTVAFYGVGLTLIGYMTQFLHGALGSLFPLFSEKDGASDLDAIADSLEFLTRITTIISTFLGTVIILYAKHFLIRWLGPQFASTYLYVVILALPFVFSFGFLPCAFVLNTTGKHRLATWIEFSHGCANLALSLILVKLFGAPGVAWGTSIPAVVFIGFIIPFFACKRVGLKFSVLWLKMFLTVCGSILLILPIWFMLNSFVENSYISLAKIMAVHVGVYLLLGYFILLPRRDSMRLKEIILNFFVKDRQCQV